MLSDSAYSRLTLLQPDVLQWKLLQGKMMQKFCLPAYKWLPIYNEATLLNLERVH